MTPATSKKKFLRWVAAAVVLGLLVTAPGWAGHYGLTLLLLFLLYLSLGQMWNLLAGFAGLVSLGQQMFIGLGGYTLAVLTEYYGMPLWVCFLVGGLLAVGFAFLISAPIFKMRGVYFSIATWITAEALGIFFSNWEYVRRGMGFFVTASYHLSMTQIYYLALAVGLGSLVMVYLLLRSRIGLALMAMRDDQDAAETMGVQVFRCKLYCFLLSALVTGVTGVVLYLYQVFIQPFAAFGIAWTVAMVFIVIIGGIGTLEGPIIGAAIYVLLQQFLSEYVGVSLLILGVIALAVILTVPKGIMGGLRDRFGLELLPVRRR